MMKKRILGTLFGFLALFGFGAIYYGLLTADSAAELMAEYDSCLHEHHNTCLALHRSLETFWQLTWLVSPNRIIDKMWSQ